MTSSSSQWTSVWICWWSCYNTISWIYPPLKCFAYVKLDYNQWLWLNHMVQAPLYISPLTKISTEILMEIHAYSNIVLLKIIWLTKWNWNDDFLALTSTTLYLYLHELKCIANQLCLHPQIPQFNEPYH